MFRSSLSLFFIFYILTILIISLTYGKNITNKNQQQQQISSTRKPTSIQICGPALVRMLDMICDRARQLLMKKRQIIIDDDPYTRIRSMKDYAQFNNTLIGDCCLQACTLKILLKYC